MKRQTLRSAAAAAAGTAATVAVGLALCAAGTSNAASAMRDPDPAVMSHLAKPQPAHRTGAVAAPAPQSPTATVLQLVKRPGVDHWPA